MNWRQAFGHCAQLGGHLVVIDDEQEFNFTRALLSAYAAREGVTNAYAWFDGTDYVIEGRWFCPSKQALCPYLGWASDQPNNHGGNEHCLGTQLNIAGGLNDGLCSYHDFPVCEFECDKCSLSGTSIKH